MESPEVDGEYLLKKFPGKGGWTYASIPEIKPSKHSPFGWVRVKGTIDGYALERYKLMPFGNGELFLPVKAEIRKKIKKEAGDTVYVKLSLDEIPEGIPEELMECFENESPQTKANFMQLPEFEQNAHINWIYDAKTEDEKVARIVELMKKMS